MYIIHAVADRGGKTLSSLPCVMATGTFPLVFGLHPTRLTGDLLQSEEKSTMIVAPKNLLR